LNTPQTATTAPETVAPVAGAAGPKSYGDIVKSSSIIGGAQCARLLISMVSTKVVAALLGPSGVGLVGLYQSATDLVGMVSGLGIGSSAVRQVAEAHGSGNPERVARTVKALRRACWATGLSGWLLTVALARPLSVCIFRSPEHAGSIALLGATLLFASISSGQMALVQGVRRIGELARLQVLPGIPNLLISVCLYAWLGQRGIVPVLVTMGAVNLGFSWWVARRVPLASAAITWRESFQESGRLVSLGVAFMWCGVMAAGVGLATRAWIFRGFGTGASGIYQAAWVMSGAFTGLILQAMGTDFYPRLTAAAKDNSEVNRLTNEQTEAGVLLALPGLLAALVFAPWAIQVFYTGKFLQASELLPWFLLGIFGKVVSWPLAYIQLAKGNARTYAASETAANGLLLLLTWLGLRWWQVPGVAVAFALQTGIYVVQVRWVAGWLTEFRWSSSARRLVLESSAAVLLAFCIPRFLPPVASALSGGLLAAAASYLCIGRLTARLGPSHRISRFVARFSAVTGAGAK